MGSVTLKAFWALVSVFYSPPPDRIHSHIISVIITLKFASLAKTYLWSSSIIRCLSPREYQDHLKFHMSPVMSWFRPQVWGYSATVPCCRRRKPVPSWLPLPLLSTVGWNPSHPLPPPLSSSGLLWPHPPGTHVPPPGPQATTSFIHFLTHGCPSLAGQKMYKHIREHMYTQHGPWPSQPSCKMVGPVVQHNHRSEARGGQCLSGVWSLSRAGKPGSLARPFQCPPHPSPPRVPAILGKCCPTLKFITWGVKNKRRSFPFLTIQEAWTKWKRYIRYNFKGPCPGSAPALAAPPQQALPRCGFDSPPPWPYSSPVPTSLQGHSPWLVIKEKVWVTGRKQGSMLNRAQPKQESRATWTQTWRRPAGACSSVPTCERVHPALSCTEQCGWWQPVLMAKTLHPGSTELQSLGTESGHPWTGMEGKMHLYFHSPWTVTCFL